MTPCSAMLAVSVARAASSKRRRGWYGFGPDPRRRDLDGAGLAGGPLRDQRGEAASEALRPVLADGHDTTIGFGCVDVADRPGPRRGAVDRSAATVAAGAADRARNSSASRRYASAPGESGRYRAIGWPWLGRLGEADAARDDRLEDRGPEVPSDLRGDIGGQVRAAVVHGQQHAPELESRVQVIANEIERGEQLGQSFQRVVLTLERDQHGVGGGQGVHGQESERWRAVDEDVVVAVGDLAHEASQATFPGLDRCQFDLGAGQGDGGWHDVEAEWARHDEPVEGVLVDDGVIDRAFEERAIETEPARRVPLWVQVDDEDAITGERADSSRGSPPSWSCRRRPSGSRRRSFGPLSEPARGGLTVI